MDWVEEPEYLTACDSLNTLEDTVGLSARVHVAQGNRIHYAFRVFSISHC